jgi:hypothetical protein
VVPAPAQAPNACAYAYVAAFTYSSSCLADCAAQHALLKQAVIATVRARALNSQQRCHDVSTQAASSFAAYAMMNSMHAAGGSAADHAAVAAVQRCS